MRSNECIHVAKNAGHCIGGGRIRMRRLHFLWRGGRGMSGLILAGAALSVALSAALLTSWCLVPRWRTLLNYVITNQVVIGTLHQLCLILINELSGETLFKILIYLNDYLFLASLCWSLCVSMVTYLKLVLTCPGRLSCEKRKATAFAGGVFLVTKLVTDCFIANVFHLGELSQVLPVKFVLLYVITAVNLFVFVKVVVYVMSCCRVRVSGRWGWRVVSIIGVSFVCDAVTNLTLSAVLIGFYTRSYDFQLWIILFYYRLVPQAVVVLFNKKSRNTWSKYLAQRRNNRQNIIQIQNLRS
ncbi:uncharacterized protein [Battus philenor]|uniref:uncharacterized protein isoform X1 n=1 Tax=Battus philenor TaxID=42288 RepID=UPI0035CEBDCD